MINQISVCLQSHEVSFLTLGEWTDQLNILDQLEALEDKIESLIKLNDYDAETASVQEYYNKISLILFPVREKIRENNN